MVALTRLDEGLWTAEAEIRVRGLRLLSRMTAIRLPGGGLWLHSPIRPGDDILADVQCLGPVTEIIAPNAFHHLFADAWRERHPAARLHAPAGLHRKHPGLHVDAVLTDVPDNAWRGSIDQVAVAGIPRLSEVAFFHRASRTVILTDLLSNVGAEAPWAHRLWMRLNGAYGRPATTRLVRLMTRSRQAAGTSLRRILTWDFDRLVVGHGRTIEHDGRAVLERALTWILPQ